MSQLEERLEGDYIKAVKDRNSEVLAVLRLIKSAIQNEKIAKKTAEFSEEDTLKILKKEAKKRQDSIEAFKKGGRDDLAAKEEAELTIVKIYLPQELSEEDLDKIVSQAMSENNFGGPQDFGLAMKAVMAKVGSQAEGVKVSQAVKKALSK